MDNKEFDKILRERFENNMFQERSDGWQKLSTMLPAAPKKRRSLIYWKIAASVFLLLSLGTGVNFLFQKQSQELLPSGLVGNQNIQNPSGPNHSSTGLSTPNNRALSPSSGTHSNLQKNITANTTSLYSLPNTNIKQGKNNAETVTTTSTIPQIENKIISQQPYTFGGNNKTQQNSYEKANQRQVVTMTPRNTSAPAAITTIDPSENTFSTMPTTNRRATAIAFGGGMNYGVLNTGYNLNLSAKHALSKHVFVEGSIAFLYNGQAEKSSIYAAQNFSPTRPAPGQVSSSRTTNPAASNFYYLSVNPTMGYQVNKTIALSAGPDLQQRIASLGQDGTSIYTPGSDPRIIPQLDLGFTGKADFLISPKIETSILFRNGLSNLLKKPDLHPYLNRRYIQVQLNYNFLLGQ